MCEKQKAVITEKNPEELLLKLRRVFHEKEGVNYAKYYSKTKNKPENYPLGLRRLEIAK